MTKSLVVATAVASAICLPGCIQVKTESEIKPIHITMDVNLKVDKELDKAFADENMKKPQGDFKEIKALLDRQAAGMNNQALLEARAGASDNDKILIAESNARRIKRFEEIAQSSGVSVEAVKKRSVRRFQEKVPAGSGVWLQDENGTWSQK